VTLTARTSGRPAETAAAAICDAVRAADPQAPVSYEKSFDGVVEETFARPREIAASAIPAVRAARLASVSFR
jgi:hypothetical protein